MKLFLAIDPGAVSGAWGAVDELGQYWDCQDIPHSDGKIDSLALRQAIKLSMGSATFEIAIELVGSMPKQGVSSTYKFGRAVGAIEAVCELTGCSVTYIRPAKWKKEMSLTSDKHSSLNMARNLFPNAKLSKVKDHNKAEALLLALWLRHSLRFMEIDVE
jgi:crossover junction endodeoxyribonuclease RuvC